MARSLSVNFREAMNAPEDGRVAIFLLTIEHDGDVYGSPQTTSPLRFSGDPTELVTDVPLVYKTVSRGEDYFYLPMQIVLPDEREGAAPRAQIRISNINREVLPLIRSVITPARAKIELVFAELAIAGNGSSYFGPAFFGPRFFGASYFGTVPTAQSGSVSYDNVEVETPWLDIISIRNAAQELVLDLTLNSMTAELLPTDSFDPAAFPGLFSTL
jgi:hypothetical protein